MKYIEYGKENRDVILLLHGGGLSWWNFQEIALRLQSAYRVVLPVLDGHAGSDRDFTSIEDNAAEIIKFIDTQLGGSVLLLGGVSLGGQVLLEILSRRVDICRYALIESALVLPSKFIHALIRPAFGSCYGLVRRKWFARLQFRSLRIRPALFEAYFRDTCAITKENMIRFLQANALYDLQDAVACCSAQVHIFVGAREKRAMRRSAERICERLPGSALHVLPGMHHGEFSINHAAEYADRLLEITKQVSEDWDRNGYKSTLKG